MRCRIVFVLTCALAGSIAGPAPAAAQRPPSVRLAGVGWGVDTTAPDVGDIVRLVRAYLAGPATAGDSAARAAGLWQDSPDADGWPTGDITRNLGVYQGFPGTVVGVTSLTPGDSVYVVKVLYANADSSGAVRPLALQRLHAVRSSGPMAWKLTSAFPWNTRNWQRLTVGRLHFRYAPGIRPDSARAARAAAFVDSVARLFQLTPPGSIGYLVAGSQDEYYRAVGIDFFALASGRGSSTGGQAGAAMVFAGDPRQGEGYIHELVHVVLQGSCCGTITMGEGLAAWLGGSKGRSTRELYRHLVAYQSAHPGLRLEQIIAPDFEGSAEIDGYEAAQATNALLIEAVFRRRGIDGVRVLMPYAGGAPGLLALISRSVPEIARDPEGWWRRTAAEYAR